MHSNLEAVEKMCLKDLNALKENTSLTHTPWSSEAGPTDF